MDKHYAKFDHSSAIKLAGVKVKLEWVDGGLKRIKLSTGDAVYIIQSDSEYASLRVLIPAPPAKLQAWRLHGTIDAIPVDVLFKSESYARARIGNGNLELEPVEVDAGSVKFADADDDNAIPL